MNKIYINIFFFTNLLYINSSELINKNNANNWLDNLKDLSPIVAIVLIIAISFVANNFVKLKYKKVEKKNDNEVKKVENNIITLKKQYEKIDEVIEEFSNKINSMDITNTELHVDIKELLISLVDKASYRPCVEFRESHPEKKYRELVEDKLKKFTEQLEKIESKISNIKVTVVDKNGNTANELKELKQSIHLLIEKFGGFLDGIRARR